MKRVLLLLPICLLALASLAEGADCGFWDRGTEPAVSAPPEGFTEALVLDALDIEGDVCGWAVKPWGKDDRLYVAVVEQDESLAVGVFERRDSLRLRARGRLMRSAEGFTNRTPRFHHFDFAPYRIKADETAIGIRVAHPVSYSGGWGDCQSVSLLRLHGDRLDLVLYTQMDYSASLRGEYIEGEDVYARHQVEAKATLAVSDRKTEGYFDYVKSMKFSTTEDRPDSKVIYAWSGDRYRPQGEVEPLEINCLIPGWDMGESYLIEGSPKWVAY